MEDNLLHSARRVVRFFRIDDERHGGLITRDTIHAVNTLAKMIEREEKRIKDSEGSHEYGSQTQASEESGQGQNAKGQGNEGPQAALGQG